MSPAQREEKNMVECVYCNFKFDAHDTIEGEIIGGDAYCKVCMYSDAGHPGESMIEPIETGYCKRCKREEVLGQFSRLCNDCADDMAS